MTGPAVVLAAFLITGCLMFSLFSVAAAVLKLRDMVATNAMIATVFLLGLLAYTIAV